MEKLLELAQIVNRRKVGKIEVFDRNAVTDTTSKFNRLYQAITGDEVETDGDAAKLIYGNEEEDAKYRQLKSRFTRRLLNTVFLIDVNNRQVASVDEARVACARNWGLVMILRQHRALLMARYLTRRVLRHSESYHLSTYALQANELLADMAAWEGNEKELLGYEEKATYWNKLRDIVFSAKQIVRKMTLVRERQSFFLDGEENSLDEDCTRVLSLLEQSQEDPFVNHAVYSCLLRRSFLQQNFTEFKTYADEFLALIEQRPAEFTENCQVRAMITCLIAQLQTADYNALQTSLENYLSRIDSGSDAWYNAQQIKLLCALRVGKYRNAAMVYNGCRRQSHFRRQNHKQLLFWWILGAWTQFAVEQESQSDANLKSPSGLPSFSPAGIADVTLDDYSHSVYMQAALLQLRACVAIRTSDGEGLHFAQTELARLGRRKNDLNSDTRFELYQQVARKITFYAEDARSYKKLGRAKLKEMANHHAVLDPHYGRTEIIPWETALSWLAELDEPAPGPKGQRSSGH